MIPRRSSDITIKTRSDVLPFSGASSRWLQRYAPALLAVALIIAMSISLAWQAAGWLRLQRSPVAVAASPVSHESIRSDPTRLARLFGTSAQDPNAPPPATNLDLVLKGSFVQSDPKLSSAIIQRQGDKPHRYAVDGEISDGVKLHAVYRDRVELQRGGRLESLPFPHRSGGLLASADDITSENDSIEQLQSLQDENAAALRERLDALRQQMEATPIAEPAEEDSSEPTTTPTESD
ncbi:type II secretion system protein N [Pseudomonas aeruginosa]|uniref:type II secretion system protein N n=1 Tax=Pseudomonas aeruginosa TaxID=287 RepID=UPI0009A1D532|nr:type II secretion system protein N [Pseudomonas aeruginosa]HBO5019269.1 type II secretion system protein N [Pseudomonas aeruginosa]HCT5759057.1 type II secretion system protein N [Pseudomonas aeruginosa]